MKTLQMLILIWVTSLPLAMAAQEAEAAVKVNPYDNNVTGGPELYGMYCATCHGRDGKGGGPAAGGLKRRPPDLTLIAKHNKGQFPDFRIAHIIDGYEVKTYHGSREMPIWGDFFHDMKRDDIQLKLRMHNLTQYIRSIQR
jgi:mono/diheme cytochrome c family protein